MKSFHSFRQRVAILTGVLSCCLFSFANIPEPMSPPRLVNDFATLFAPDEVQGLEDRLRKYRDTTSTEIAVVTIADLEGFEIADYANQLARKWGVGDRQKDNGILILISLTPRKVTIQTGYGVEEKLPDIICSRIIRERIKPYFKEKQFAAGIHAALDEMEQRLAGTWQADAAGEEDSPSVYVYILILFILLIFFFSSSNRNGSATFGGRGYRSSTPPLWFPGRSGGGFSGGSGGSSFGGFGGGSFGGGGASGDW